MPRNPELFRLVGYKETESKESVIAPIKDSRTMARNPELNKLLGDENVSEAELSVEQVGETEGIPTTWRMLTLGFTATGYVGDLNFLPGSSQSISQFTLHPGLDISFRKDAPRLLLPVFRVGYGKFSAQSDQTSPVAYPSDGGEIFITPNNYAESVLIYGEVALRISPFFRSLIAKPYFELGLAGQSFFPRAQDGILLFRKRTTRAPDEAEYPSFMAYFPLSAGLDYQLSTSLSLQLAYTYKVLGSDYLDNIGKLGLKSGNDVLHVVRLGLGFRFADRKKRNRNLR